MKSARRYSLPEAAVMTGIEVKTLHNAIDKGVVRETLHPTNKFAVKRVRMISETDLLKLKVWHSAGALLPADRRRKLFAEIEAKPSADTVRAGEYVIIEVGKVRSELAKGESELAEANRVVTIDSNIMGGEPVFAGTRISVYAIANMLSEGVSAAEILEGYPKLDARLLRLGTLWTAAHPRRGRPKGLRSEGFKAKTVVRKPAEPRPPAASTQPS